MGSKVSLNKTRGNKIKICLVYIIILIASVISIFINSLNRLETKLMPTFVAMTEIQVKQIIGACIDEAIINMHDKSKYKASDFYTISYDENGNVSLIENNSILINEITNDISYSLDNSLSNLDSVKLEINIFDALLPELFDEVGPKYKMDIMKDGYAAVNYNSEISEISGNQTNFKAFVEIEVSVKLLSPLFNDKIIVNRKVLIVDSIISTKNVGLKLN